MTPMVTRLDLFRNNIATSFSPSINYYTVLLSASVSSVTISMECEQKLYD